MDDTGGSHRDYCDVCGVKYDLQVASYRCPVCGARHPDEPRIGNSVEAGAWRLASAMRNKGVDVTAQELLEEVKTS